MTAIGLGLVALGVLGIVSGVQDRDPVAMLRAIVSGEPLPPPSGRSTSSVGGTSPYGTPTTEESRANREREQAEREPAASRTARSRTGREREQAERDPGR